MSRTKTISSVDAEIKKAEKKELQGRIIMDSFVKSGKSMDEVMIFLGSGRK